jgi:DNA-binding NarL/FixJ family response regulator
MGPAPAKARPDLSHLAIVDSHCLTRECITNHISGLIESIKLFSFVSVEDCNHHASSQFSLIILYLHASEFQPLDHIRSLRSAQPDPILFLISDHEYQADPEFIRAAWRLGTRGFVSTKTTSLTLALSAIRFVQAGGFFAPIDALLLRSSIPPESAPAVHAASELTARESVVLGLLKEGKTNKIIARDLRLSSNTVKVHVHNILRKMQVSNRTEAASRVPSSFAVNPDPVMTLS